MRSSRAAPVITFIAALAALWAVPAAAQPPQGEAEGMMQQRIDQVLRAVTDDAGCANVTTAIDLGLEILYGGIRALPSKGELLEQTLQVDKMARQNELKFAQVLGNYSRQGKCEGQRGRALDLMLFVEEMSEVAQALGRVTRQCGVGDVLNKPPCDDLQPLLDEATGEERTLGALTRPLQPSFSVKLRSPFVPPWILAPEEDIRVTEPIAPDHCSVVFKEFKGMMLRLHLERIILVTDPWVTIFGFPRATLVPIWRLEWVFSEYGKTWSFCNVGGKIATTVSQRVKQDRPLNFFWRFYKKDP